MNKRYDIISFHPGKSHNFEQAEQINKYFKSYKALTSIFFPQWVLRTVYFLNKKLYHTLKKRSYRFEQEDIIDNYPWYELERLIRRKLGLKINWVKRSDGFQKWVINNYEAPKIAIGIDSASRLVFRKWKGKSFCILDLGIGLPQYRVKIAKGKNFKIEDLQEAPVRRQKQFEKYLEEVTLADLILCGSEFVKTTCLEFGVPEEKIKVLHYGVELERFKNTSKQYNNSSSNIQFVFIGAFGHRKGGDVLLSVWKKIKQKYPNTSLTVYGKVELEVEGYRDIIDFRGHVDQEQMIEECKKMDVLVFPSSFEGSSLSIYQAMAMKLTVIATYNSGSVIEKDQTGILLEYGDKNALYAAMEKVIINPNLRKTYAEAAYNQVQQYTWDEYGKKLKFVLKDILHG